MKKFIFIPLLLATMFFGTQTAYSQKAYRTRSVFEGKNKSKDIYFNALYPIGVEATPENVTFRLTEIRYHDPENSKMPFICTYFGGNTSETEKFLDGLKEILVTYKRQDGILTTISGTTVYRSRSGGPKKGIYFVADDQSNIGYIRDRHVKVMLKKFRNYLYKNNISTENESTRTN